MILQQFTLIQTKCSTFSSFNTETFNIDAFGAVSVNGTNDGDEGGPLRITQSRSYF